ncbi:MAG: hypothetical protein A2176_09760 [Spirochaetes bacterium RBG_13_51_14]|nr:MAG: hypothetical protein A2176_09760 [Spirochaetes bacterium RBG_13_51_14]
MTSLVKNDKGVYLVRSPASGVTIGVAAKSSGAADYAADSDGIRKREKDLLFNITGVERKNILMLDQRHEDTLLVIEEPPRRERLVWGDADGFITRIPGVCLVIRTADCVPVFAYDRERRVLGAAHSGWRGTRLGIARTLVRSMGSQFGSEHRNTLIYILPSIGPESYTVGSDVADLFPGDISENQGMLYLDLWRSIERSLLEEGIPAANIFNPRICSLKNRNEFFSYRDGDTGRNLNFGFMQP